MHDVISGPILAEHDGFEIAWYALVEHNDPHDTFAGDPEDDAETFRRIENGTYLWFCACVTASRHGVELARDYLGGCCYDSLEEFVAMTDGYAGDMLATVTAEANKTIALLAQEA